MQGNNKCYIASFLLKPKGCSVLPLLINYAACLALRSRFDQCTCALAETHISRFRAIITVLFCCIRHVLVHTCTKSTTFAEQIKNIIISFSHLYFLCFFFVVACLLFWFQSRFLFTISSSLLPCVLISLRVSR